MTPQITTIIPSFRRPKTLGNAVQSALDQTFSDIQVCIYDDASGEETEAVGRAYANQDSRVHYHCHPSNIGSGPNFQYGFSRVNTPFFSFLSDDDVLLPEFYETALSLLHQYPHAAACVGSVVTRNEQGHVLDYSLAQWPHQESIPVPQGLYLTISHYSNWTGVLFRTSLAQQVGPLNPDIRAIDFDFMLRLTARFPIIISKKPCALFADHSQSHSRQLRLSLVWPSFSHMIAMFIAHAALSVDVKKKAKRLLESNLQRQLVMMHLRAIEARRFDEAGQAVEALQVKLISVFLRILAKACQYSWLCYWATVALLRGRRIVKRQLKKCNQQQRCVCTFTR